MKTEQLNLRLDSDLVQELERVANEQSMDRGTVVRRLLAEGLRRWRRERAIEGYLTGRLSLGGAAEEANLSQWELLDAVSERRIAYPLEPHEVRRRLATLAQDNGEQDLNKGFRTQVEWQGVTIESLADIVPNQGGILLVGLNPAPASVASGHYYQGSLGKRLWKRLARLGLLVDAIPGAEDVAWARAGHGLTDVVKRPSRSAAEIADRELHLGVDELRRKVNEWEPGIILFPFKRAAEAVLGTRSIPTGAGPTFEGVPTFLLSGPYAATEEAQKNDRSLRSRLVTLQRPT